MRDRILVTGATGFTGTHVVRLLVEANYRVRCFVRLTSKTSRLPDSVEIAQGDLSDTDALTKALGDADVLVNVASLGFGQAPNIVGAALASGIRRAVFVSTTAVETTLNAATKSVRLAAEESIRDSGLAFTILRPTMIYGTSEDRNVCRLIRFLQRWPVIPILGDGESLQQPVYVADVARALVQTLGAAVSIGQTYNISGATPFTYNYLIDTLAQLMGCRVRKIHLPPAPFVGTLKAVERVTRRLPIKAEQLQRLNENKTFDHAAATRDFGYQPLTIVAGLTAELTEMGLLAPEN